MAVLWHLLSLVSYTASYKWIFFAKINNSKNYGNQINIRHTVAFIINFYIKF